MNSVHTETQTFSMPQGMIPAAFFTFKRRKKQNRNRLRAKFFQNLAK